MQQPDFRKDRLPELFLMLLFLLGMIGAIVTLMLVIFLKKPPPVYLSLTPDGQITQDAPLDQPNLPENVLLNWVNEVMTETFTFNFKNYQRVLDSVRPYYTSEGYAELTKYLADQNILPDLQAQKWVYSTFALSAPQVQQEGVVSDRYVWDVLIPIRTQLSSVERQRGRELNVRLLVTRVPTIVAPMGFQVYSFKVEAEKNGNASALPPIS